MKTLETGISTKTVKGHIYVHTEKEALQLEQGSWWKNMVKKNELEEICEMQKFINWHKKIKNIHLISNEKFVNIQEMFNEK
jgi:hypothetical protein